LTVAEHYTPRLACGVVKLGTGGVTGKVVSGPSDLLLFVGHLRGKTFSSAVGKRLFELCFNFQPLFCSSLFKLCPAARRLKAECSATRRAARRAVLWTRTLPRKGVRRLCRLRLPPCCRLPDAPLPGPPPPKRRHGSALARGARRVPQRGRVATAAARMTLHWLCQTNRRRRRAAAPCLLRSRCQYAPRP
jgi:hypothetical protein